jgi:hypothetical protein
MAIDRKPAELRPAQPERITYDKLVKYPSRPDVTLPTVPQIEVRRTGFLGLGVDAQDAAHLRRMTDIQYLGQEIAFTEHTAIALEAAGIDVSGQGALQMEETVASLPRDSVAAQVAADLATQALARMPVRRSRLMETYDAETMNTLHRR